MGSSRTTWFFVAAAAAALVFAAPAQRAAADPPEFVEFDATFVDPFLSEICGATIEVRLEFELIAHNGQDVLRLTTTYTNIDTGAQVVSQSSGVEATDFDEEAGALQFTANRALRIVVPGSGAVYVSAGRTVETFVFDPETGDLLSHELVEHGRNGDVDLVEVLCSLLT
jgi:hypothetical protein